MGARDKAALSVTPCSPTVTQETKRELGPQDRESAPRTAGVSWCQDRNAQAKAQQHIKGAFLIVLSGLFVLLQYFFYWCFKKGERKE